MRPARLAAVQTDAWDEDSNPGKPDCRKLAATVRRHLGAQTNFEQRIGVLNLLVGFLRPPWLQPEIHGEPQAVRIRHEKK